MASFSGTALQIPCCICGTMIVPNAANQCSSCLAQDFDLKSLLQRGPGGGDIIIHQCRQCRRFERTERNFDYLEMESPALLSLCLKHIPALSAAEPKMNLVDAMWIFTEPHSMRLKVRLTVRTEVQNVMIQQRVAVELYLKWKQCPDCNREYTNRVSTKMLSEMYCLLTLEGLTFFILSLDLARNCPTSTETSRRRTAQGLGNYRNGTGQKPSSSKACFED